MPECCFSYIFERAMTGSSILTTDSSLRCLLEIYLMITSYIVLLQLFYYVKRWFYMSLPSIYRMIYHHCGISFHHHKDFIAFAYYHEYNIPSSHEGSFLFGGLRQIQFKYTFCNVFLFMEFKNHNRFSEISMYFFF